MPDYFKNHPVYYAGPAKTPAGYAIRKLRPDYRRAYGFICRSFPEYGGIIYYAGKREQEPAGD